MIDPHLFAHDPDAVRASLRRRGASPDTFASSYAGWASPRRAP